MLRSTLRIRRGAPQEAIGGNQPAMAAPTEQFEPSCVNGLAQRAFTNLLLATTHILKLCAVNNYCGRMNVHNAGQTYCVPAQAWRFRR